MTFPIIIEVDGSPVTQGSKTAIVFGGRARLLEGKSKTGRIAYASWRDGVAAQARLWLERNGRPAPIDAPLRVTIAFRVARPKSAPTRVTLPAAGLDIDKAARAVLDSLTHIIYVNDSRVVDLILSKRYALDEPPGARIIVEPA